MCRARLHPGPRLIRPTMAAALEEVRGGLAVRPRPPQPRRGPRPASRAELPRVARRPLPGPWWPRAPAAAPSPVPAGPAAPGSCSQRPLPRWGRGLQAVPWCRARSSPSRSPRARGREARYAKADCSVGGASLGEPVGGEEPSVPALDFSESWLLCAFGWLCYLGQVLCCSVPQSDPFQRVGKTE